MSVADLGSQPGQCDLKACILQARGSFPHPFQPLPTSASPRVFIRGHIYSLWGCNAISDLLSIQEVSELCHHVTLETAGASVFAGR